jgi:hypothetical protein
MLIALTYLATIIEIGVFIIAFSHFPIYTAVLIMAAYHGGYMLQVRGFWFLPGAILLSIGLFTLNPWLIATGMWMTNSAIQRMRGCLKKTSKPRVAVKNVTKYAAMAGASIIYISGWTIVLLPSIMAAIGLIIVARYQYLFKPEYVEKKVPRSVSKSTHNRRELLLLLAETVHHMHYFAYVYVFWALFPVISPELLGFLWILGWVFYGVVEDFARRRATGYPALLIAAGHILCALVICSLAFTSNSVIAMLLWVLTGFFGGTCYFLNAISHSPSRESWENWGHCLGCLCAAALVGFGRIEYALYAATLLSLLTAFLALTSSPVIRLVRAELSR